MATALHAQAPAASTITLAATSGGVVVTSVSTGTVVTLTASVTSGGSAVTRGQVHFCDASATYCSDIHLLGTAQLTSAGTAVYRFRPGTGAHSYRAEFAGTNAAAASTSNSAALTVTGSAPVLATSTVLAKSGNWGNYALTATVTEMGATASPSGTVSFVDTSTANAVLGSASLGAGAAGVNWIPSTLTVAGMSETRLALGDFNEDGVPDLAVPLFSSNQIAIYLGNGDGTFTQAAVIPESGSGPFSVLVADLNQDGHQDLVVLNNNAQASITILLGKGDGTFSAGPTITGYEGYAAPYDVTVGDFNGDGTPDLAVLNESDSQVTILLGNGDGTFSAGTTQAVANEPLTIAAGDFNGDGKLDLAIGTNSTATTILLGKGDGTFNPISGPAIAGYASSMVVADFNGDGKTDLAIGNGNNVEGKTSVISVFLGNGDGTFTESAAPVAPSPEQMVVTDINQDGIPDLVTPNAVSEDATVLLGRGDGTFTAATPEAPAGGTNESPFGIAAGDFNGDGRADLAISWSGAISIDITEPTETAITPATTVLPGSPGSHLVEASYPGDSVYEASASSPTLLWGQPSATVTTLAMTAGGNPATNVPADTVIRLTATVTAGGNPVTSGQVNFCDATAASCTDIHEIGSAQLNGAGIAVYSFVPGSGTHEYKAVFLENAVGTASSSPAANLTVQAAAAAPVATATSIAQSGTVGNYTLSATVTSTGSAAPMTGSVSFQDTSYANAALSTAPIGTSTPGIAWHSSFTSSFTNPGLIRFALGDFNGDGIPDIAVVNTNAMEVMLYLGNGDGTFRSGANLTLTTYTTGVVAADFNGDGKLDLAVSSVGSGNTQPGSLAIYLGNGDGTFTPVASAPAVGGSAQVIAAADINGDGRLDLIVNDSQDGTRVLLGNGDGTFAQAPATGLAPTFAVADLNGDGIPDLVVGGASGTAVELGYGDGTFQPAAAGLPVAIDPGAVAAGDFNGDGIPDLAVTGVANSGITIFLGKGDGTFPQSSAVPNVSINEPLSIVVGDFNHDGKADLVVSNWNATSGNSLNPDLTFLLGNGDGTFTAGSIDTQFHGTAALLATDINGDGIPDLVADTAGLSVLITQPTQTATVSVSGIAPTGPAPHLVDAVYSGDANYLTSRSGTTSLEVQAATPVISVASGTYTSTQTVNITDATPGVTIYYSLSSPTLTTNGYVPYTGSLVFSSQGSYSLAAYASETGYQQSATTTASYTLNLAAAPAPVFHLAAGAYPSSQSLTITDSPGVTIYYTTNGLNPTVNSAVYSNPITISSSETVIAFGAGPGYSNSPDTSASYIIGSAPASLIYTLAGNDMGGYSGDKGPATIASLNYPEGIATDNAGNLYIADTQNNVVRRVDAATGTITTVAGTSLAGYGGDNGAATSATLTAPVAAALDSSGNLYIADSENNVIRRVSASTGVITTYAGTGAANPGSSISGDNGPATSAPLGLPSGVVVDGSGDLYLSDGSHCAVRKVTAATGIITTVAGGLCSYSGDGGPAVGAGLFHPTGLAFDGAGNLYIADSGNNAIRKVAAGTGIITTVAGAQYAYSAGDTYTGDGGPATSAHLYFPTAIAFDHSGDLVIADTNNDAVRAVDSATGIITSLTGSSGECGGLAGDGYPAMDAGLCYPQGLAVSPDGSLLVADSFYNRIRAITPSALPPSSTTAAPVLSVPGATYANAQTLSITDATPGAKIYVTLDGSTATTANVGYRGPIPINGSITVSAIAVAPGSLASSPVTASYTITAPPPSVVTTIAGNGTSGFSGAGGPALDAEVGFELSGAAADSAGNLYVADPYNNVVWRIDASSGNISLAAGTGDYGSGGIGGAATSAQLALPSHVTVDSGGNLYISDTGNERVVKVDASTGILSMYPAAASAGWVRQPEGLAVDKSGNLYVADTQSGAVFMVNATTGTITKVVGGGSAPPTNGASPGAVYISPEDVALDSAGDLYIAEFSQILVVSHATGLISIVAGDGDPGDSGDGLPAPQAEVSVDNLAVDTAGNVYFTSPAGVVRVIASGSGTISTAAGSGYGYLAQDGISATLAGFSFCVTSGLAVDSSGNLYLADSCGDRVRKITFSNVTAAPAFSLTSGLYHAEQSLLLTDSTPNAVIYYTTNGDNPTTASAVYGGPIWIASSETVKAVAVAPGLAASSMVSAAYQIAPALTTPAVTVQPAYPTVTTTQSDRVTVTVSGGNGNPTPTGSVTLSSGSYTSAATTLSAGSAVINIPAGQLAVGSDTLTAFYTPDSGSSATYDGATGTAPVTVTQAIGTCTTGNPNPNPNPAVFAAPGDFDGDCKSDILWHNSSTGYAYTWLMNGTSLTSAASPGNAASPWTIQGYGDFDGDGKADILWRNSSTGVVYIWLMNGTTLVSSGRAGSASSDWVIAGVGDFDGDGKSDILWRNTSTGFLYLWLMNGTTIASSASLGNVATVWNIAGVGDFNGDGKADILWRNSTTGVVYLWLMNGTTLSSSASPGSAAAPWTIEGVGDFNGDGKSDILWQNTSTGQVYIWFMNGTALASATSPGTVATPWTIKGVGDYNGDGKADMLWQNSNTGQVYVWLMNGATLTSSGSPGSAGPPWEIVP